MINTDSAITLFDRLQQLTGQYSRQPTYGIEELCRTLGVSRSHLFRVVKEKTGLSLTRYIRQQRMLHARFLLETTDLRIIEIADRVGLDSPQTLSKYFTRAFGLAPTDFRKSQIQASLFETCALPARPAPLTRLRLVLLRRTLSSRWLWQLGAGLLLLVVVGWLMTEGQWPVWYKNKQAETSIAVLPFRNLGTPETRYFSNGVMEQIHTSLAGQKHLRVTSRTSVMTYRQTGKPIGQIARELGVTYLLDGEVMQLGKHIKLSVELIRADRNQTVWSSTYEGDQQAISSFMSQTATQVANELHQQLSPTARQQVYRVPTHNLLATYSEYLLRGQFLPRPVPRRE